MGSRLAPFSGSMIARFRLRFFNDIALGAKGKAKLLESSYLAQND